MVTVVIEETDNNKYRINCTKNSCNSLLEYKMSDLEPITSTTKHHYCGIKCPNCGRIIKRTELIRSQKTPWYKRIFGK